MTFLTNKQQELLQKHYEIVHERFIQAIAQFHFQTQPIEIQERIEQMLAEPSPPYQLTPRGCGLMEDRLCENMSR